MQKQRPEWQLPLVGLVLLALIVGGVYLFLRAGHERRLNEQESEARANLEIYCEMTTGTNELRCEEYARQAINRNRESIADAVFCGRMSNPVSETDAFGHCIVDSDIPLPS